MNARELIDALLAQDPNAEVFVLTVDGAYAALDEVQAGPESGDIVLTLDLSLTDDD